MAPKNPLMRLRSICLLSSLTFLLLGSPAAGTFEQFYSCLDTHVSDTSACKEGFQDCMNANRGYSTCLEESDNCFWTANSNWGSCTTSISYPQAEMDMLCEDLSGQREQCMILLDNCLSEAAPGEDGICWLERDACLEAVCTAPCGICP